MLEEGEDMPDHLIEYVMRIMERNTEEQSNVLKVGKLDKTGKAEQLQVLNKNWTKLRKQEVDTETGDCRGIWYKLSVR